MHIDAKDPHKTDSMVTVLLQYVEDTKKYTSPEIQKLMAAAAASSSNGSMSPTPPSDTRPSASLYSGNSRTSSFVMPNFMGRRYFNRDMRGAELVVQSRFFAFPTGGSSIVAGDTAADFSQTISANKNNSRVIGVLNKGLGGGKSKLRRSRHRNLSQHLVTFSCSQDCNRQTMHLQAVQTFMSVSETHDPLTASCCLIGISNICAMPHVRTMLIEANVLHKFPTIYSHTKKPTVTWATALLYYYFSIDLESENTLYSLAQNVFSANCGAVGNFELQTLTLYTLSNLIGKCIDSKNIAELIMTTIKPYTCLAEELSGADSDAEEEQPYNRAMAMVYLPLILGFCEFTNIHTTLVSNDILEIFCQAVDFAVEKKDHEIALYIAKIVLAFFTTRGDSESHSNPAAHLVSSDSNFSYIIEKLLEVKNNAVLRYTVRCLTVMSGSSSLVDTVTDGSIIAVVSTMIEARDLIPIDIALDIAKYFSNICQPFTRDYLTRLVEEDGAHIAILQLFEKCEGNQEAQAFASRALQNILSNPSNCESLAAECIGPVVKVVKAHHEAAAVDVLYNISCLPQCMDLLAKKGVHVTLLSLIAVTESIKVKERYLQVMLQLSTRPECINDFVTHQLIRHLSTEIKKGPETAPMWSNAVSLILTLVNSKDKDISEVEREMVVNTLRVICQKSTPVNVIVQASVVLAYLSLSLESFVEVDGVLRSILSISNDETVLESISTVLYNVTCSDKNTSILLQDSVYINIMLKIMRARNGKPEVQLNIARSLRTLCSLPRCVELLLMPAQATQGWVAPGSLAPPPRSTGGKDSPLADLIVIALLVATGEEIKLVCSEAFYNMLCHRETRMKLVRGDLWWAVTKLSREGDNEAVKLAGVRALLDLSCDYSYIVPLREHRVLSFLQDAGCSRSSTQEFLDQCMRGLANLVRQFSGSLASYEILATLRLSVECLRKCANPVTVHLATSMLLLCARQKLVSERRPSRTLVEKGPGSASGPAIPAASTLHAIQPTDGETIFCSQLRGLVSGDEGRDGEVQMSRAEDLVTVLAESRSVWGSDARCRLQVSRLLWLTSSSQFFTRKVPLLDLQSIMTQAYSSLPSADICENFAGVMINYVLHECVSTSDLVSMSVFHHCVADAFHAKRSVEHGGRLAVTAQYPIEIRAMILSLMAHAIDPLMGESQGKLVSRDLVGRLLTTAHITASSTRDNLLVVLLKLSTSFMHAGFLFAEGLMAVLLTDMESYTFPNESMNHYCSACIRNMALHPALVPTLLVENSGLSSLLLALLEATRQDIVCLDICVLLYSAVSTGLDNGHQISSTFCLDLTGKIASISKDPLVARVLKYTVGEILEKYSEGVKVNPAFVQAMYSEMLAGSSATVAVDMASQELVLTLPQVCTVFPTNFLQLKSVSEVLIDAMEDDPNQWHPYMERVTKRMTTNILVSEGARQPLIKQELLVTEAFPVPKWEKIDRQYDAVGLPPLDAFTEKELLNSDVDCLSIDGDTLEDSMESSALDGSLESSAEEKSAEESSIAPEV